MFARHLECVSRRRTSIDDILVVWLKEQGIPVTRNVYLAIAFPEGEPDPWTEEDEMMLPACLKA